MHGTRGGTSGIAPHIGGNCAEGEWLLRSLLRSAGRLVQVGVMVPAPARYRPALRSAVLARMRGHRRIEARDLLLDAMLHGYELRRLVLSKSAFLSLPPWAMEGAFLASAGPKLSAVGDIVAEDRGEALLAVRNPATWLPPVFAQSRGPSFEEFMGGTDPRRLRWSGLVTRLREAAPDTPLTVWRHQDAVLVCGEVTARLVGLPPDETLDGRFDLMAAVATVEGMECFGRFVARHPGQGPVREPRLVGAVLGRYAIPERVEVDADVHGWDAALTDEFTHLYEADLRVIARMDGVSLVAP